MLHWTRAGPKLNLRVFYNCPGNCSMYYLPGIIVYHFNSNPCNLNFNSKNTTLVSFDFCFTCLYLCDVHHGCWSCVIIHLSQTVCSLRFYSMYFVLYIHWKIFNVTYFNLLRSSFLFSCTLPVLLVTREIPLGIKKKKVGLSVDNLL